MEQLFPIENILYIEYTDVNKCQIVDEYLKIHPQDFGIKQAWEYYGENDQLFRVNRKLIVKLNSVLHVHPNKQLLVLAPTSMKLEHVELGASTDALRKLMNLIINIYQINKEKILLDNKYECFWFYQKEILYLITWSNVYSFSKKDVQGMTEKPMSMMCFMNGHTYKSPFPIDESDQAINMMDAKRKDRCSKICLVNVDRITEINIPKQKMWVRDITDREIELPLSRRALQNYQEKLQGYHRFAEFLTTEILRRKHSRYTKIDDSYLIEDITEEIIPRKMKGLSKSKYTTYCQCPKALWLKTNKPEASAPLDDATKSRMATGSEVGELARGLFGPFVDVTTKSEDGTLDLKAMIDKTNQSLADGSVNIAEASFSYLGNYCAVDILHKTDAGWEIYEVKSSTGSDDQAKNKHDDLMKYAHDIAYQKFVLEQCGVCVAGTYLVRLNCKYIRGEELDIQQLFHITNMESLVNEASQSIDTKVHQAQQILNQDAEPNREIGKHCKKPYQCSCFDYCRGEVPENSVFNLYRMHFEKKVELFKAGKVSLADLEEKDIRSMIHEMQYETFMYGDGEKIDKQGICDFLDKRIHYPLYFLDFETVSYAIPQFADSKPYQQIPFQYSLHYIEQPGGELKHKEFLGDGIKDPRRALAEQLVADIPLGACTTAYNKGFECSRIKEMASLFPDLASHLMDIHDHVVDFLDPFQQGYFYKVAMRGSFSIKKVLPALFPDDPALDYHNLTGGVQNGGDAMTIYPKMATMTDEERDATRRALLDYCWLDTYAMVKVWEKLVKAGR